MIILTELQSLWTLAIFGALVGAITAGIFAAISDDNDGPGCIWMGVGAGLSAMITPLFGGLMGYFVHFYDVGGPPLSRALGYAGMGILFGFVCGLVGGAIGGTIAQLLRGK